MSGFQRIQNSFEHRFGFLKDLGIPEPQHAKSCCFDASVALLIVMTMGRMLSAIKLDRQLCLKTSKVGDVVVDRHLAAEAITAKLAPSKRLPKVLLGVREPVPQFAGAMLCNRISQSAPTPTLPRAFSAREGEVR